MDGRRTRSMSTREEGDAPPTSPEERPRKRRSRFDENPAAVPTATTASTVTSNGSPSTTAASRAAEISKRLNSSTDPASELEAKRQQAAEMQKRIQDQIASVSSSLAAAKNRPVKRAMNMALRLDDQGREIDEQGNLVQAIKQVKTLKANLQAQRKAENPYLSHKGVEEQDKLATQDPRLKPKDREKKARKAFQFVEAGTFVRQAEFERHREERMMRAGVTSNRNVGLSVYGNAAADDAPADEVELGELSKVHQVMGVELPPPVDEGIVPSMEWWDELFLPKDLRAARARSRVTEQQDAFDQLNIENSRTYKLVQHPVPVKPLGGESKSIDVLPVYLTKKERKRIRRKARMEREQEKRDKMMMGLIPPPEPKFKLSNFMKVLGDQAVADPSKVEQRVLLQMRQRQLNHEMRNQARKLTPQEEKEKKRKKLQEDTSRQVQVAIFRVRDLSDTRHRFKVDVNAQQYNLTGIVLVCQAAKTNLVVVEGGPKAIKKFIKLMIRRIDWNARVDQEDEDADDDNDDEEEDNDKDIEMKTSAANGDNRCDLLWQGTVIRKSFHMFRFQECKTAASARKVMDAKSVAHYWDMAVRADKILESQELVT